MQNMHVLFCVHLLLQNVKNEFAKEYYTIRIFGEIFYYLFEQSQHTKYFIWGLVIRRGHLAVDFYRRAVVVINIVLLLLYLSRISSRIQVII